MPSVPVQKMQLVVSIRVWAAAQAAAAQVRQLKVKEGHEPQQVLEALKAEEAVPALVGAPALGARQVEARQAQPRRAQPPQAAVARRVNS
jgi:hypothetical protein